jgi:DNA-binding NarL/FixJ family response regulator
VKNHVSRIFSKLQVTARTQAAIYAIRNGIV